MLHYLFIQSKDLDPQLYVIHTRIERFMTKTIYNSNISYLILPNTLVVAPI